MEVKALNLVYFSPTGTTKKIIEGVASSFFHIPKKVYDLTAKGGDSMAINISKNTLTLIGLPVYSGRLPLVAIERLKHFKSEKTPAVLVVVYGNRHYDDALVELRDIAVSLGFLPIAAATFIGEHSFSSADRPIAIGRPDAKDMRMAHQLGTKIRPLLEREKRGFNLTISGNTPYKERGELPPLTPETDINRCDKCGLCVEACPTQAITIDDAVVTNKECCIWCCACVKVCSNGARFFENEILDAIRTRLYTKCQERHEPELFL